MQDSLTARKKILHVDDEPDISEVVATILNNEGYEVNTASRSKDALNLINSNNYDLIILDIMMPDMSGWELFTTIITRNPNTKVVFLSVLDLDKEKIREFIELGVKDYIRKPTLRDNFIYRINKVINEK